MSFNLKQSITKLPSPFFYLSVTLAASLYGQAALSQVAPDTLTSLGVLPGGAYSDATAISADGSVVVGGSDSSSGSRAYRWVDGSGMTSLGVFEGGTRSFANGVSADGSVVVGTADKSGNSQAFRWVEGAGLTNLGTLAGGDSSYALGVNADGSVVVGHSETFSDTVAFRWTEAVGMTDLGTLSGGTYSYAYGVNANGSVVVGYGDTSSGDRAFRWVDGEGMESLGVLAGGTYSYANGVNTDGSVVVGLSDSSSGERAFIYKANMLDLVNTQAAIGQSGAEQASAVALRNRAVDFMLERELEVDSNEAGNQTTISTKGHGGTRLPMAIRLDASVVGNSDTGNMQFGGLSAAIGVSNTLTLGGFAATGTETTTKTGFEMSGNQPAMGLYLRSRQPSRTGVTWKLAVAGSSGNADIARSAVLANTEAGTGSASLDTTAASAEFGYGFARGNAVFTPFVRIATVSTDRGAFAEDATVSFPASFNAYSLTETTLALGLNSHMTASSADTISFGIGLERDLSRSSNSITGTSTIPGLATFSVAGPSVIHATRAKANVGLLHAFGNGMEGYFNAHISQSAYVNDPTMGASIGFGMRF